MPHEDVIIQKKKMKKMGKPYNLIKKVFLQIIFRFSHTLGNWWKGKKKKKQPTVYYYYYYYFSCFVSLLLNYTVSYVTHRYIDKEKASSSFSFFFFFDSCVCWGSASTTNAAGPISQPALHSASPYLELKYDGRMIIILAHKTPLSF